MRKKAIQYGAAGVAALVLAVLLVGMVNWIGARRYARWDWTSSKIYSLSEKTENILSQLEEDIEVVVFMVPGVPLYDHAFELLSRFEAVSDRVTVDFIDPERERLKTDQLAKKFGISVANTVVFVAGDRTKYVTSEQMAEYDYSGMQYGQASTLKAFKGEEEFIAAILSLVAPDVPKIYFVGGHGEAGLDAGSAMSNRGLAVLQEALKRENMETAETVLLSGVVPEDADALAIIGPTQAFTENEITLLDQYLDNDGRLLICLDPLIDSDGSMRSTRLEGFLAARGVIVRDDLVIDPARKLPFYDLSAVYLDGFRDHPITQGLEGVAVLFLITRSVGLLDEGGDRGRVIVETTADGWGETDLAGLLQGTPMDIGETDTKGPVGVAAVLESPAVGGGDEVGSRIVVFGDSDFLSDNEIANVGNLTLALNTFNWLVTRDESVGIPPRQVDQLGLYLKAQQLYTILFVVLILMPGTVIVVGLLVWRRRRR